MLLQSYAGLPTNRLLAGQVVDVGDSLAKEKENSPEVGKAKEADS